MAKGPDGDFNAIFLYIDAAGKQQTTHGYRTHAVILAPLQQPFPIGRIAFLYPGFPQFGIFKGLESGGGTLGLCSQAEAIAAQDRQPNGLYSDDR